MLFIVHTTIVSLPFGSKRQDVGTIGKTAKPQYGRVNFGYGTPRTNGTTLISIQNRAGKRIFSFDFDSDHAVHMHLPKILPKRHIPIEAISSGIYYEARQW